MRLQLVYLILAVLLQRDTESIHGVILLDDQAPGTNNIAIKLEINRWGGSGTGMPAYISEEGDYWFHQLAAGEYQITAVAPGYRTVRSRVELHRGGQVRGITKLNLEKIPELPVISYDGQLITRNELAAPAAAKKHLQAASLAMERSDFETAGKELDAALAAYPNYARAILLKGQIQDRLGRRDAAAALFEQAVKLDPDLYEAYLPLAEFYRKEERVTELRELSDGWKQKQPTVSTAYFYAAIARYETGEYTAALKDAQLALGFPHAQVPHLRLLLANIYVKLNQPAQALGQLEVFLSEYPDDPQVPEAQKTVAQLRKLVQKGAEATDQER